MAPVSAESIAGNNPENEKSNVIRFNVTKNELYKLDDGYKTLMRRQKGYFKIVTNTQNISSDAFTTSKVFVLAGPREKFTANEFDHLKRYLETGGSLLVLLGEGGEKRFDTNINFFLEEYGIMINNDSVVRTNYHKYFHPKEVLISNGVLNRAISEAAGKTGSKNMGYSDETVNAQALSFVYPYGATLNVAKPAVPVLSTGSVSFPLNRPVCAFYTHPGSNGKLVVVGSGAMFSDQYIDKEDNHKIKEVIFDFLTNEGSANNAMKLNEIDAEDPEISDYNMIPDTCKLADSVRVCLQESDEIPADYTRLFEHRLFSISTSLVPSAIRAYDQLGVKHEQLRLISPQFETPLPPLAAAVFPPTFRELANPQVRT